MFTRFSAGHIDLAARLKRQRFLEPALKSQSGISERQSGVPSNFNLTKTAAGGHPAPLNRT